MSGGEYKKTPTFKRPTIAPPPSPASSTNRRSPPGVVVAALAAFLLLVLVTLGWRMAGTGTDKPDNRAFVAAPLCSEYQNEIDQLNKLQVRGEYSVIVALSDSYLSSATSQPCPPARTAIARFRYQASVERAFQSAHTGAAGDHDGLRSYREASYFADETELALSDRSPGALAVAQRAYEGNAWELARGAFHDAWLQGAVAPTNFDALSLYYATLVNLGVERSGTGAWRAPEAQDPRTEGLQFLCDADALARAVKLPRAEAPQRIREIFGSDARCRAPTEDDPVLRSIHATT